MPKRVVQEVICDYCNTYQPKKEIRQISKDVNICFTCRKKRNDWVSEKRKHNKDAKFFVYPKRPYVINIFEREEEREEINKILEILGYDIKEDIHKQFLVKHNLNE
jgi:hypothetical protein